MSVLFFGDSIAHGYKNANKAAGVTKVGASPSQVLSQINTYLKSNPSLTGKTVYLSSGYSNGTSATNLDVIKKQINTLKGAGANVILLGVSKTFKGSGDMGTKMNNQLSTIAGETGAKFMGGFDASKDNIHPKSYTGLTIEPAQTTPTETVAETPSTATPVVTPPPVSYTPTVQPVQPLAVQPVDLFGGVGSGSLGLNFDLFASLPQLAGSPQADLTNTPLFS